MAYARALILILAVLCTPLAALAQEADVFQGEHNGFSYTAFRVEKPDTLEGTVANAGTETEHAVLAEITAMAGGQVIWKKFVFLGDMAPGNTREVAEPFESQVRPDNISVRLYPDSQALPDKNQGFTMSGNGWTQSGLFNMEQGPSQFAFIYRGDGLFNVTLLSSDNTFLGTLISAEGEGEAIKNWDIDVTFPCKLEINAEGPWSVGVMHPDNPISLGAPGQADTRIEVEENEDGVLYFTNY